MSESLPGEETDVSTESGCDKVWDCPTCSDTFDTNRGVKIHHKLTHGDSLPKGRLYTCEWCEEDFRAWKSSNSRFCGKECKNKAHSEEISGQSHPRYKGKVELKCNQCGDTYKAKPSKQDNSSFCSRDCQWDWQRENWKQENHPAAKEWVTVECKYCGSPFRVKKSEEDNATYCDRKCMGNWRSENIYGENHPQYEPNTVNTYGPNWFKQRKEARKRDDHTCQSCGKPEQKHYRALPVHHITPIRWFKKNYDGEWWKEANKLDNLVTLCDSCHKKWEGIPVRPKLI